MSTYPVCAFYRRSWLSLASVSSLFVALLVCAPALSLVQVQEEQGECVVGVDGKETCNDETLVCVDKLGESECASLAKRKKRGSIGDLDGCIESFATMRKQCAKTCQVCDHYSEALLQELQGSDGTEKIEMKRIFSQQFPQVIEGRQRVETFKHLQDVEEYMYNTVYNDNDYAEIRASCQNRHELCTFWAFVGECEKNPTYMRKECGPSCFSCEDLDFRKRCPFDPAAPVALNPGDLNALFQRIMTEPKLAQYTPKALMQPNPPKDSASKQGPWIVVLENFLTDEECDVLIRLGGDRGYEQSLDVGEEQHDGTFGSKQSEERTSSNAWCIEECWEHNVTQVVHDKLEFLTGIDRKNYEYLQLLRYEERQFYGDHHDYIEHHKEGRSQGPRTLTVFLYLNDVEAGGGTHFSRLNQTVMPKRGRAVIWPSVLNDKPNDKDKRTHHEALPVEAGIKYGANAWIHQRDFKTPWKEGCH